MRSPAANSRLKTEIMHAAVWLGLCLLGGSIPILAIYLGMGNQIISSICNMHANIQAIDTVSDRQPDSAAHKLQHE